MKKRLCIGVHSPSEVLRELLNSLGVWYEEISSFEDLESHYSAIIIENDSDFSPEQLQNIDRYKANHGAILQITTTSQILTTKLTHRFVKRIWNTTSHPLFHHIPYMDVYQTVALCSNADLFGGLIHFEEPNVGFIGIDATNIEYTAQSTRKYFPSHIEPNPDELVANLSLGVLQDIVYRCLLQLHLNQDLPLVTKWTSPSTKPYFGFRIDSDFGSKEKLDELYHLLKAEKIKGTWFLHVKQHEEYLDHLKSYENQELAFHGYEHGTSSSPAKTSINLNRGMDVLSDHGIKPNGYCAPYGIWNQAMWDTIKDFDLHYLSDFSISYDAIPHTLSIDQREYLQIPIHPICTGSLSRIRYTSSMMEEYFLNYAEQQIGLQKPLMLYHHPMQKGHEALKSIFKWVNEMKLPSLSFIEIASFCQERASLSFEAHLHNGALTISTQSDSKFLFGVQSKIDSIQVMPQTKQQHSTESGELITLSTQKAFTEQQLSKLKGNRLALLKTSIIDWKNRERL